MTTSPIRAARPFAALRRLAAAAAFAAVALLGGRAALAGDPVKLLVELPPDVQSLDCGETVDIQIVGEDATKTRVGFSGKTVEVSATYGTVEVIQQPYKFRYRTPATLPDVTSVRLRAWLKEAPEVSGETMFQVIPPAPFTRLVIQGAGSTPAGASLDLLLRGETADGKLQEVPEATVAVTVEGPGTITMTRTSRYRFDANPNGSGTATVTAVLKRYPKVKGTLAILVTGGSGGAATPPASGGGAQPGTQQPPTPVPPTPVPPAGGAQNPPAPPVPPAGGGKPATEDDAAAKTPVEWTSGKVRLEAWRIKGPEDPEWGALRKLPAKGAEFVAAKDLQKVRLVVIAAKAKKIEVQETLPEKGGTIVRTLEPTKDGRLVMAPNEDGTTTLHYETRQMAVGRTITAAVIITGADDKVTRDEFVFRREEPKK